MEKTYMPEDNSAVRKVFYIGVDPGLGGALAVFNGDWQLLGTRDMPITANLKGKGSVVDCFELVKLLVPFAGHDVTVVIEAVNSMPTDGAAAAFKFGKAAMAPEAIAVAFGFKIERVAPGVWKRKAKLLKKPKDASRELAKQMFPKLADQFRLKKNEGRAEAALIAYYGKEVVHELEKERRHPESGEVSLSR
jgi:crossover junction endodeoxyribonuclease RuvC